MKTALNQLSNESVVTEYLNKKCLKCHYEAFFAEASLNLTTLKTEYYCSEIYRRDPPENDEK